MGGKTAFPIEPWKISPKFFNTYLNGEAIEKKIDVFEDRMNGWYLDWMPFLNENQEHSGFAVLHLGFSYFEMIVICLDGADSDGNSMKFFKRGFLEVFPHFISLGEEESTKLFRVLYKKGRCGFFRSGQAKTGVILHDQKDAITIRDDMVFIDRYIFVEQIRSHFSYYIQKLRQKDPRLVSSFLKAWGIFNS